MSSVNPDYPVCSHISRPCNPTDPNCCQPLDADALLTEADQALAAEPLVYPIAARIAAASACFPLAGWSCYVTDVDRSRFTISATRRDPQTGQAVNREFMCAVLEVTA